MSFRNARRLRHAAGVAAVLVAIGCVAAVVSSGALDGRGDRDAAAEIRHPTATPSHVADHVVSARARHGETDNSRRDTSGATVVAATAAAHAQVSNPRENSSPVPGAGDAVQPAHQASAPTGAASIIDVPPGPAPMAMAGVRWSTGHLRVGRYERSWWLATPEHPVARKLPLLMILHGRTADPAGEAARTGFLPDVAAGRAVAVYPAGYRASWNAGRCCGDAHAAGIDDLTFLTDLAATMRTRPDVGQLDLVGFSNGGKMAFDLVCSGRLLPHAMAVAEAVPTADCSRSPAVAMIQVAGTADPIVPYSAVDAKLVADGVPLVPVRTEVTAWAKRNGCATAPSSSVEGNRQVQVWTHCRAAVDLLTYAGGIHVWQPGATPLIWAFLNGAELAGPMSAPATGIPSVDLSAAPTSGSADPAPASPTATA